MTDTDFFPLPSMSRENTCCFTGHRAIPDGLHSRIVEQTEHAVRILVRAGYRFFLCGGALGFDMLAEQVILRAASSSDSVHLVLALPCRDQTERWLENGSLEPIREYQRIKSAASAVVYISDFYHDGCMAERNRYMVDHASFCVAYYRGGVRSGTGQTFRMAQKAGLRIYNLHDVICGNDTDQK